MVRWDQNQSFWPGEPVSCIRRRMLMLKRTSYRQRNMIFVSLVLWGYFALVEVNESLLVSLCQEGLCQWIFQADTILNTGLPQNELRLLTDCRDYQFASTILSLRHIWTEPLLLFEVKREIHKCTSAEWRPENDSVSRNGEWSPTSHKTLSKATQ